MYRLPASEFPEKTVLENFALDKSTALEKLTGNKHHAGASDAGGKEKEEEYDDEGTDADDPFKMVTGFEETAAAFFFM